MKGVLILIGSLVVILLMPALLASIISFRSTDYTAQYDVDTGGGITTTDIALSQSLFSSATSNAEVTSNNSADAPVPSAYVSATKTLTVEGLNAADSRRLTIIYKISSLDDYLGADVASKMWPILLILGVIGLIAGAVYHSVRGSD